MKKDIIETSIFVLLVCVFVMVGIIMLSPGYKKERVKKEVVKHEQRKNVIHDDGKTTEVFSHTIRYGDTMTVEIDTFIYR
jgi:magnesium-transporting ATPase (P-type)